MMKIFNFLYKRNVFPIIISFIALGTVVSWFFPLKWLKYQYSVVLLVYFLSLHIICYIYQAKSISGGKISESESQMGENDLDSLDYVQSPSKTEKDEMTFDALSPIMPDANKLEEELTSPNFYQNSPDTALSRLLKHRGNDNVIFSSQDISEISKVIKFAFICTECGKFSGIVLDSHQLVEKQLCPRCNKFSLVVQDISKLPTSVQMVLSDYEIESDESLSVIGPED
eukprot:TRINITY_DN11578_c0_g1_i1.p1 TRINITY_DN11578_c0_g1~~TRINITY_DN11578_c0_g1_i1.p1  ORF type:complete len:227 (-),score=47.06 TRINITY_DN11578_c0_g1_i1:33-713(-)